MINLKYYVLTYDFNTRKIEQYNLFNHRYIYEATIKLAKKYLRFKDEFRYKSYSSSREYRGWNAYIENLRVIMLSVWSKIEYEISVGRPFADERDTFTKIDCYDQVLPNIEVLGREILYQMEKRGSYERRKRKVVHKDTQSVQRTEEKSVDSQAEIQE